MKIIFFNNTCGKLCSKRFLFGNPLPQWNLITWRLLRLVTCCDVCDITIFFLIWSLKYIRIWMLDFFIPSCNLLQGDIVLLLCASPLAYGQDKKEKPLHQNVSCREGMLCVAVPFPILIAYYVSIWVIEIVICKCIYQ